MTETFAIPCNHEDCASKLFYMKHDPHDAPDMAYYMLADTKKLIAQIKRDDPEMIDHALRKYDAYDAGNWLKNNSESAPFTVGLFVFSEAVKLRRGNKVWQKIKYRLQKLLSAKNPTNDNEPGYAVAPALTLSQGWAGNLILIQELGLSYVPIAVHKWPNDPEGHIEQLQRLIGVEPVQKARAA